MILLFWNFKQMFFVFCCQVKSKEIKQVMFCKDLCKIFQQQLLLFYYYYLSPLSLSPLIINTSKHFLFDLTQIPLFESEQIS